MSRLWDDDELDERHAKAKTVARSSFDVSYQEYRWRINPHTEDNA